MIKRVVVIGATGTIGRPLCRALIERGHELVVFSRDVANARVTVPSAEQYLKWTPDEMSGDCMISLGGADAVIYLAGGPLFDGRRHDRADVEQETTSRVRGIATLVAALDKSERRPETLIAASSVGFYGYAAHSGIQFDETGQQGSDWWGASSAAIERSALTASNLGIRTVVLRTGYVLTSDSLQPQVAQFGRHFGGWIGLGRGWTPWIHIVDEVGIIAAALEETSIEGPINATAPEAVRSREFARVLGHVLGRHAWLPVPTPFVRMGLGAVTDILVKGQNVTPTKALAIGYQFSFPALEQALRNLLAGPEHKTVQP